MLVILGLTEILKLCPVFINANEIQQMAVFRESSESRGEGNGSNESVIICRNREFLHKKEFLRKDNINRHGKNTCKVFFFSELCKEERGLKEELARAETSAIHELRALRESVHYLCYHQSLM